MARELFAGLCATTIHVVGALAVSLGTPALLAAKPDAPDPDPAYPVNAERADEDTPLIGALGTEDSAMWVLLPPFRSLTTCGQRSGGPAIFEPTAWGAAAPAPVDHRAYLMHQIERCVHDAHANGAEALVIVNRLAQGGAAAQVRPLNDAARDNELLCCIKASQAHLSDTMRPGETRRYRLLARDEVTLVPDPWGHRAR
jgi:hypothetical protein